MTCSTPARLAARRTRATACRARRRRVLLGTVLALLLAATAVAAPHHPLNAQGSNHLSPVGWPRRGQAAFVLGNGRPAASPHEQPAAIASLAKVMTAYLTLERYPLSGAQDGFTITVTATQARTETQDAAILADLVAGSETDFIAEMNAKTRALGMDHTVYTDPSGFDASTVSTAADQLRVFEQAMRFPVFREIISMASVTLPVAGTVTNFDPLIAEGYAGKTGSDSAAGGCLAFFTQVTVGGRRMAAIGVVLGQGQGSDTSALLATAGEAAEQLVDSVSSATRVRPAGANHYPQEKT